MRLILECVPQLGLRLSVDFLSLSDNEATSTIIVAVLYDNRCNYEKRSLQLSLIVILAGITDDYGKYPFV